MDPQVSTCDCAAVMPATLRCTITPTPEEECHRCRLLFHALAWLAKKPWGRDCNTRDFLEEVIRQLPDKELRKQVRSLLALQSDAQLQEWLEQFRGPSHAG